MPHDQAPLSRLDDRARQVIVSAQRRAAAGHSRFIDVGHVLLALLAVRRGLASQALLGLCDSPAQARLAITGPDAPALPAARAGATGRPHDFHLPLAESVAGALVRASGQARQFGDDRIGTEHLLLGLLSATADPAVDRLARLGVDHASTYGEILRLRAERPE